MSLTPGDLFDLALQDDAARPYVTFVDPDAPARVELSGTTLDNWVAKTANLLRDDLGLDSASRILLVPTHHWFMPVWLLAVWRLGAEVALDASLGSFDLAVVPTAGPDEAGLRAAAPEVLVLSDHPLGLPSAGIPGLAARDFVTEVRGQGDRFVPYARNDPGGSALVDVTASLSGTDLVAAARDVAHAGDLRPGDRVLTSQPMTSADAVVAGVLAPLSARAAVVLARNLGDPPDVELIAGECVTHVMTVGMPSQVRPIAG